MKKYTRLLSLFFVTLSLTACSTFEVISLATMAVTGKGIGDHTLSIVTGQDCNFFNVVQGEKVCAHDNSVEIILLTNNQIIDDSLKVDYLDESNGDNRFSDYYLVIGSFSEQSRAESYQSQFNQWDPRIVSSDTNHRVLIGPVDAQNRESMKTTLINEGVESPWLVSL